MQGQTFHPVGASDAVDDGEVSGKRRVAAALSIDGTEEAPEKRIERLIVENPVVIFSRRACCMCHVIKRLLASVEVNPTVIELDEGEEEEALTVGVGVELPALFIGGGAVGGLEGLMALHLSGQLVPKLREAGVLCG